MDSVTSTSTITVPRLAGNLPLMIHCWPRKNRRYPRSRIKMLTARNAAPSGLPTWRSVSCPMGMSASASEVFSRKSWVTAMPMDAKASEVRSQARNVLSAHRKVSKSMASRKGLVPQANIPSAR